MRHLAVAVITAPLAFCSAAQADQFIIKGVGAHSCGRWVLDRQAGDYRAMGALAKEAWVQGYITAYNEWAFQRPDVTAGTDSDGVFAWIDNYCASHPLDTVAVAIRRLVISLDRSR
jgi:hypothetical protein